MIRRIHHVGVGVPGIADARAIYEKVLGLRHESTDEVAAQKVRVAFYPCADVRFELLEPTSAESTIAKFLEKRGPGLHHVAFEVDDIRAELARLKREGVQLIDAEPRLGAHGNLVAFLHPKSTGGVLFELVEPAGRGVGH